MHISANIHIYIYVYIYTYVYVLAFLNMCVLSICFYTSGKWFLLKNLPLSTQVDGYSSQRLAHVAAFGPVNLTLEDPQETTKLFELWSSENTWGFVGGGVMRHFCCDVFVEWWTIWGIYCNFKNNGTIDLCFGMFGNDRKIYQGALHTHSGAVFVHSDAWT